MLFNLAVNTKEKLGQVFYEFANYCAKLCDIFVLKYIRLRKFYKFLMLSSTLVVGYIPYMKVPYVCKAPPYGAASPFTLCKALLYAMDLRLTCLLSKPFALGELFCSKFW